MYQLQYSFVIVTWNCRRQIEDCLRSLEGLNIPESEVIVVDQASRDGTVEYITSLNETNTAGKLHLKFYTRKTKGNWCRNNEMGFGLSSGEWIICSNPDVVFNESFKTMLSRIEMLGPSFPLHGCRLPRMKGDLATTPLRNLTLAGVVGNWTQLGLFLDSHFIRGFFHRVYYEPEALLKGKQMVLLDHPIASLFLFHRSLPKRLGGKLWGQQFTLNCADSDMFRSAKEHEIPVVFHADICQLHQRGYASILSPRETQIDLGRGMALYMRKWGYSVFMLRLWIALDIPFRFFFQKNPAIACSYLSGALKPVPKS